MTQEPQKMYLNTYQITLLGQIDEEFMASFCPPETIVQHEDGCTILINIHMDQSGILGLVRQLHNWGCTILNLNCC